MHTSVKKMWAWIKEWALIIDVYSLYLYEIHNIIYKMLFLKKQCLIKTLSDLIMECFVCT